METNELEFINKDVVMGIKGEKLCAYLLALEGWRRGLTLKWYGTESRLCKLHKMSKSTNGRFFSLSNGEKKHYFFRSRGDKVSNEDVKICNDKERTKQYLTKYGVPVPQGDSFIENEDIIKYANDIGYPVIIKPFNGSMGTAVYTNIDCEESLRKILQEVRENYSYRKYIVEKHYSGVDYRVYVVGDKVVGAFNRQPANIVGDGIHSIENLIKQKNKLKKSNPHLSSQLIKIDFEVNFMLEKSGYSLDSVPANGERVFLREKSNVATGGDPIDATFMLSEEVKKTAVDALKALPSIPHAGIDIIVESGNNKKAVVLEINATAMLPSHIFPMEGSPRDIPGAIIDYYFPETINSEKTNCYFDFLSITQATDHPSVEEIKVAEAPFGKRFAKLYKVKGKLYNVSYLTRLKQKALQRGLEGYLKMIDKSTVEILLISETEENIDKFKSVIKKGSKRSIVKSLEENDFEISNSPRLIGLQVIPIGK